MGRRDTQREDYWLEPRPRAAEAKGYQGSAHRTEDSTRDTKNYKDKTTRDQDGALRLYEK